MLYHHLLLYLVVAWTDKILNVIKKKKDSLTVLMAICLNLRFGDISLQERINHKNFEMLEAYYKSLSEKVSLECKCTTFLFLFTKDKY